jgi:hypothetical protein
MRPLLLTFLMACASTPDAGTSVGNPGDASLAPAASAGLTLDGARWTVSTVTWRGCGRGAVQQEIGAELDLSGEGARLPLPQGEWCEAAIEADGLLELRGVTERGGQLLVQLELDPVEFAAAQPVRSPGPAVALELGPPGWLTALAAQTGPGARAEIRPGDREHDRLVALVATRSRLIDADRRGESAGTDGDPTAGIPDAGGGPPAAPPVEEAAADRSPAVGGAPRPEADGAGAAPASGELRCACEPPHVCAEGCAEGADGGPCSCEAQSGEPSDEDDHEHDDEDDDDDDDDDETEGREAPDGDDTGES